jgi:hypothetical protein
LNAFVHEQKRKFSQDEFVAVAALLTRSTRPLRYALVFALGIGCLFWSYTVALGVVLLILGAVGLLMPLSLPAGAASTFRGSRHLHGELTYRITDRELAVTGEHLRCQCAWENLGVWREKNGWLVLSPHGMPQFFLATQLLREAGVYESVLALARQHGREFGTKNA